MMIRSSEAHTRLEQNWWECTKSNNYANWFSLKTRVKFSSSARPLFALNTWWVENKNISYESFGFSLRIFFALARALHRYHVHFLSREEKKTTTTKTQWSVDETSRKAFIVAVFVLFSLMNFDDGKDRKW